MDARLDDRALVLDDAVVVTDCHLGKGASAVELPVGDTTDVVERFEALLDRHEPSTAVVAGDLLHSFRTIPANVVDAVSALASAAESRDVRLVVTPGNHDTQLDVVWDGETAAFVRLGDTVVCHGHDPPPAEATGDVERYVVGHDHPTIVIEGRRRPCALFAPNAYEGADVVMLPAYNRLLRGVVVNDMDADAFMSPLLTAVDDVRPLVEDDGETLSFPPLSDLRGHL